METIKVTFPKSIDPVDVQFNIMGSLKKFNGSLCNVVHVGEDEGQNSYTISADSAESFYLIGMTASSLINRSQFKTATRKDENKRE
jgi:hypothetical protein